MKAVGRCSRGELLIVLLTGSMVGGGWSANSLPKNASLQCPYGASLALQFPTPMLPTRVAPRQVTIRLAIVVVCCMVRRERLSPPPSRTLQWDCRAQHDLWRKVRAALPACVRPRGSIVVARVSCCDVRPPGRSHSPILLDCAHYARLLLLTGTPMLLCGCCTFCLQLASPSRLKVASPKGPIASSSRPVGGSETSGC